MRRRGDVRRRGGRCRHRIDVLLTIPSELVAIRPQQQSQPQVFDQWQRKQTNGDNIMTTPEELNQLTADKKVDARGTR